MINPLKKYWIPGTPILQLVFVFFITHLTTTQTVLGQVPAFQEPSFSQDLTNITVKTICQDASGYIWIGTSDGLYQSNGIDLQKYDISSFSSIDNISALNTMEDGSIWIGTTNGDIGVIKDEKIDPVIISTDSFNFQITGIVMLAADKILIATYGGGLFQYKDQSYV